MIKCNGKTPDGSRCGGTLYECECGNVGCVGSDECSFTLHDNHGRCAVCGSTGKPNKFTLLPIMNDEFSTEVF